MEGLLSVLAQRGLELDLRLWGFSIVTLCRVLRGATHRVHLDLGERVLAGCPHDLHDLDELVVVVSTSEQRVPSDHFCKAVCSAASCQRTIEGYSHATDTPNVDACAISPRSQQDIRRSVPQRDDLVLAFCPIRPMCFETYLVAERVDRHTKRARQSKVTNLKLASSVDQQVLGLQISVQDPIVVAERDTLGSSAT